MIYRINAFLIFFFLFFNSVFAGEIKNNFSPFWTWTGRIFDFLGVLFILIYFLKKPTLNFFKDRTKQIKKEIYKAEKLEKEISVKLKEIEKKLEGLDDEILAIEKEYGENAKSIEEKIKSETELEIEKIKLRIEKDIENLVRKGMDELKQYAALKSIELSHKMLVEKMGAKEKEKFFEEIISTLEKK